MSAGAKIPLHRRTFFRVVNRQGADKNEKYDRSKRTWQPAVLARMRKEEADRSNRSDGTDSSDSGGYVLHAGKKIMEKDGPVIGGICHPASQSQTSTRGITSEAQHSNPRFQTSGAAARERHGYTGTAAVSGQRAYNR